MTGTFSSCKTLSPPPSPKPTWAETTTCLFRTSNLLSLCMGIVQVVTVPQFQSHPMLTGLQCSKSDSYQVHMRYAAPILMYDHYVVPKMSLNGQPGPNMVPTRSWSLPGPGPYPVLAPTRSWPLPGPGPYPVLVPTRSWSLPGPGPYPVLAPTRSLSPPGPGPYPVLVPARSWSLPDPFPDKWSKPIVHTYKVQ